MPERGDLLVVAHRVDAVDALPFRVAVVLRRTDSSAEPRPTQTGPVHTFRKIVSAPGRREHIDERVRVPRRHRHRRRVLRPHVVRVIHAAVVRRGNARDEPAPTQVQRRVPGQSVPVVDVALRGRGRGDPQFERAHLEYDVNARAERPQVRVEDERHGRAEFASECRFHVVMFHRVSPVGSPERRGLRRELRRDLPGDAAGERIPARVLVHRRVEDHVRDRDAVDGEQRNLHVKVPDRVSWSAVARNRQHRGRIQRERRHVHEHRDVCDDLRAGSARVHENRLTVY